MDMSVNFPKGSNIINEFLLDKSIKAYELIIN